MIELSFDPVLEETHFAEVQNKSVHIGFFGVKRNLNVPVMAVDERAMTVMIIGAVGERNVRKNLSASLHAFFRSEDFRLVERLHRAFEQRRKQHT